MRERTSHETRPVLDFHLPDRFEGFRLQPVLVKTLILRASGLSFGMGYIVSLFAFLILAGDSNSYFPWIVVLLCVGALGPILMWFVVYPLSSQSGSIIMKAIRVRLSELESDSRAGREELEVVCSSFRSEFEETYNRVLIGTRTICSSSGPLVQCLTKLTDVLGSRYKNSFKDASAPKD